MVDKADVEQALRQGDLIEVHWLDATEDPAGDVKKAGVVERVSFVIFWEIKEFAGLDNGNPIPLLITTTTLDKLDTGQSGYCAYPLGMVQNIKLIRRGRKTNARNPSTKAHRAS